MDFIYINFVYLNWKNNSFENSMEMDIYRWVLLYHFKILEQHLLYKIIFHNNPINITFFTLNEFTNTFELLKKKDTIGTLKYR